MPKKNYCVYMHENKSNGKKYCGITSQNPEIRWRSGNGYSHNKYFYNAIKKYGWDGFSHIVIFDNLSLDEANHIEAECIRKYKLTDSNFGYNQTAGGDGTLGYSHTVEAKEKMSIAKTGHICSESAKLKISQKNGGVNNGMYGEVPWNKGVKLPECVRGKISSHRSGKTSGSNHPLYGKQRSDVVKQKISDANRGKVAWNKGLKTGVITSQTKRVGMFNDDGELVKEFQSIAEAARCIGGYHGNISKCCAGTVKHSSGYVWRYL